LLSKGGRLGYEEAMALKALPRIDYSAHPLYGGMFEPHPRWGELASRMLEPLIEESRQAEQQRAEHFGYRYSWSDGLTQELAEGGVAKRQLPAADIDRIEAAAQPIVDLVQARLSKARAAGEPLKYKTALEPAPPDGEDSLWDLVDRALANAGLYEATATVFDAPSAKLRSLGVLVNLPDQDWATRLYRDIEIEAPPTAGFHIDSDCKCFTKIVLYLNDVGPEHGPFGIVPGSHRWGEGSEDRIYRSAFDRSTMVVRSAKWRRRFISLPPEMQTKAEFGGDMLAGSSEAEALLAEERVMTGPRGQLNLFNPDAIHRGGNVRSGERRVLLISIGPRWNQS
jgi:hypothetical protein